MTFSNHRTSPFPIDSMFLDRWSPRAFTGAPIRDEDLMTVLEAARWAPSASNNQPWRFVYARNDQEGFADLLALLDTGNQTWARSASALVFIVSDTLSRRADGTTRPARSHSFDAGAAWAMLALQAMKSGLVAHAMGGVDFERAMLVLNIPADHRIEAAVAIGYRADKSVLPDDLQAREMPNTRRPLTELAFERRFKAG